MDPSENRINRVRVIYTKEILSLKLTLILHDTNMEYLPYYFMELIRP
jgi:hypothetical protein